MASFIPRRVFPTLDSLPRSYFLGHHRTGLTKMRTMLSHIDLIIECRDYRVPLTSRNPLFEEQLAGRERFTVYTKRDVGSEGKQQDVAVGYGHPEERRGVSNKMPLYVEGTSNPKFASSIPSPLYEP